jgi:PEGA domain-containing protein
MVPDEEPTIPPSAAAIGTASITSTSRSWSGLATKPGSAPAITVCAFACGLIVGVSVMWLTGTSGHAEAGADTTKSQQPQREPARVVVPVVVPIRSNATDARVPQAQLTAPTTKPPTRSRTVPFRGVLVVNSRPSGARVFLNGQSVGTTPLVLKNQRAGSRAVRLTLDGYDSWTLAVRVVADTETRLQAQLRVQQPPQP